MIKLLNWFFGKFGYTLVKLQPPTELEVVATEFVAQLNEERFKDQSGEWKRSQVLRMLMNRFPTEKTSTLAWTIENVLRK